MIQGLNFYWYYDYLCMNSSMKTHPSFFINNLRLTKLRILYWLINWILIIQCMDYTYVFHSIQALSLTHVRKDDTITTTWTSQSLICDPGHVIQDMWSYWQPFLQRWLTSDHNLWTLIHDNMEAPCVPSWFMGCVWNSSNILTAGDKIILLLSSCPGHTWT